MIDCTDIGLPPQVVLRFIRAAFPPTRHCLGSSLRSFSEHVHSPTHLAFLNQILHIYFNLTLCDLCTGSSAVFQLASQPLWTILVSRLLVGCLLFLQLLKGCNFPIGLLPVFEISKSIGVSPKISAPTLWRLNWSQPIPPRSSGKYSPMTSSQNQKKTLLENNIVSKTSCQSVPQFSLGSARLCSNSVSKSCH